MRYGFCTDIATKTRDRVEYSLIERIKDAGFDFVEFPLMMIETLSKEEFEILLSELKRIGLDCDVCCNYFPGRIKVVGPSANKEEIDAYLEKAVGRAFRMGAKKIVFGSCPSRNLPDGMSAEEGYIQLEKMIRDSVVPSCEKYNITVVIEPIRKQSANFILTVKDGKKVVDLVGHEKIRLLADIMHMNYNEENPEDLRDVYPDIRHVHICEYDRKLPEKEYSEFTDRCLTILADLGYNRSISFESKDAAEPDGLKNALNMLKEKFCN